SPSGGRVTLRAERLVPLSRREVVATRWHVEAHDDVTVAVRPVPGCTHGGAEQGRTAPGLGTGSCRHEAEGTRVRQRTVRSERGVAVETAHRVEAADDVEIGRAHV